MSSDRLFNTVTAIVLVLALGFTSVLLYLGRQEDVVEAMSYSASFPYESLFDQFQVLDIGIELSEEDWADIMSNPVAEEYKPCNVTVNGNVYTDAAIRTKGNTSLSQVASTDSDRYSFKIEFDHYDKNKSMDGLDKLVLNNLFCDATYVKEYIAYDIFHYIGVETPYYAFADIKVNGENFGCYLALEAVEDSFVKRVYQGEGQLYKPESDMAEGPDFAGKGNRQEFSRQPDMPDGEKPLEQPEMWDRDKPEMPDGQRPLDMLDGQRPSEKMEFSERGEMRGGFGKSDRFDSGGGADLIYTDDNPDSYSNIFGNAVFQITGEDEERVIEALQKLNAGEELEKYIDADACLRYFAAQTFIVNLDSYYSNLKHNYYLYESGGQLTILPWDLNLAFGGFQTRDATQAVNSAVDSPMDGLEEERPLFSKLMEVEEYKERYHEYLNEIAEGYVNGGIFETVLSKTDSAITPYVENDATAFYSYQEFTEAIKTLKAFVLLRAESVERQLQGNDNPVDASHIQLNTMGWQNQKGFF